MANDVLMKLFGIPDMLKRRSVVKPNGSLFGIKWMNDLIAYFESETAALSVTYPARVYLEGWSYDGEIEVGRDGSLIVRLCH